jgi:hypothetical protein
MIYVSMNCYLLIFMKYSFLTKIGCLQPPTGSEYNSVIQSATRPIMDILKLQSIFKITYIIQNQFLYDLETHFQSRIP